MKGYSIFEDQNTIMLKLIHLSFAVLVCSLAFGQPTTLLFQDFEGPFPAGWTTINNDGLTPDTSVGFISDAWVITPDLDDPTSGDSVATSTSWYSPAGTADDWLISPSVALGTFGNKLSFKAKSYDGSFPDGFQVFASTHNVIDSFIQQDTLLTVTAQSPYWTRYFVSLDSFDLTGQTIYLAFRNNSEDQYLLSLDSIYVGMEHPVNTEELSHLPEVRIFPNPTSQQLNIVTGKTIQKIEILTIGGQLILSSKSDTVDVSQLSQGVYFIKIHTPTGFAVRKFQKS